MTGGERRFGQRLEMKLEDDYWVWYDIPVGRGHLHPDFIVLHPLRGILILEVKDWRLDTLRRINKRQATLLVGGELKQVSNPYEQARHYAQSIADLLEKEPSLRVCDPGRYQGRLVCPWSYGVVLSSITRRQFDSTDLDQVLPSQRVICKDEMYEDVDTESFQKRLWDMFPWQAPAPLSLPQIDRIRACLYPELLLDAPEPVSGGDPEEQEVPLPDVLRIMDIQQEQLARSLGEGHRVIHGVAGSGKTMILGYRCLHLAKSCSRPILVLCYNVALAQRLEALMREKGLTHHVSIKNFHAWCRQQLVQYQVELPQKGASFFDGLVEKVISGVDRELIPTGQYGAVLIDEGHDFRSEWLRLVSQMVDPGTNALLLLYDDAQSIYDTQRKPRFSFKSVGIQAQGRTTILKLNYRNTVEILNVAYRFAQDILRPKAADDDGVPLIVPETAGRHGHEPKLIRLPTFNRELEYIAEHLSGLHDGGTPWGDMAILYRWKFMGEKASETLVRAGVPVEWLGRDRNARYYHPNHDSVKILTFHACKGLEFPVTAIPGLGYLPRQDSNFEEEARLLYVAMTRSLDRLLITCHRDSQFVDRLNLATQLVAA